MTSALMSLAYADGFETLVFKTIKGESYFVETQGLEIYFKDGTLTFNNNEHNLPVDSLSSMEFSDNSGVEGILSESVGSVVIYSVDGIRKGEFPTIQEACSNLKPGIYVVRNSNGGSFKINLRQ